MKEQFPIFTNNPELVFLDSAASAQKPKCVIDTMVNVMETSYANIHRGLYDLSQQTTTDYENARKTVAKFVNAEENEIIFTRGATESINLVAQTWGKANLKAGDEVIISILEHHANIVPWQILEKEIGIKVKVIPLKKLNPPPLERETQSSQRDWVWGNLDFEAFKNLITSKTKLLSITGMSNALGITVDVKKYINEAKKHSIITLIDACQSIVHSEQDVKNLGCDFMVFSGHKLYGPTGIGALYGKYSLLEKMPPYQTGGDMIKTVSFKEGTTFAKPPARFEAGTPAIVEAIALGTAIDFIRNNEDEEKELYLTKKTLDVLNDIDGINVIGANQCGIISFTADWGTPQDIAMLLSEQNIAVRIGHHCAMPLMEYLEVSGTIRISFAIYNNENDVAKLEKALLKCKKLLG